MVWNRSGSAVAGMDRFPRSTQSLRCHDNCVRPGIVIDMAGRILESWGMDIRALPEFLDKSVNERTSIRQPGLVIDTIGGQHQVEDLILFSRQENNNLRIAIKGDKKTEYRYFDKLIDALQNRKVNKFNLITTAKSAQE